MNSHQNMTGLGAADRIPWDVTGRLGDPLEVLAAALPRWEARDESRPQGHVRRSAYQALEAMGEMAAALAVMRARLVSEIGAYDDAAAARRRRLAEGNGERT